MMTSWNNSGQIDAGGGNINAGHGTQHIGHSVSTPPELMRDLELLERVMDDLRLTGKERQAATTELTGAKQAADASVTSGHLQRFVKVLNDAGAVAEAGVKLTDPLSRIGRWLGPVGMSLLALL